MIRFIDLRGQINDDSLEFAWYSTIVDRFETWGDNQIWESWEEFERDYTGPQLERYKGLFRGGVK